jgi:hypothetical protein
VLFDLGSEYFLRQPIPFEHLQYPLRQCEHIEPLIDLCLHRSQFIREIPRLDDLSIFLFLPKSISARVFVDSTTHQSGRHQCHEWRTKEKQNAFTIDDLCSLSQRENLIIQVNARHDRRYLALKDELTDIYSSQISSLFLDRFIQMKSHRTEHRTQTILPSVLDHSRTISTRTRTKLIDITSNTF